MSCSLPARMCGTSRASRRICTGAVTLVPISVPEAGAATRMPIATLPAYSATATSTSAIAAPITRTTTFKGEAMPQTTTPGGVLRCSDPALEPHAVLPGRVGDRLTAQDRIEVDEESRDEGKVQ